MLFVISSELLDYVWTNSVQMITEMVRNGSQEICSIVYKSLEDLLSQQNCVSLIPYYRLLLPYQTHAYFIMYLLYR